MSIWNKAFRQTGIFMAFILTLLTAATAFAQSYTPPALPPIRQTLDANGVDLTSGVLVSPAQGVSIGGTGNLGLSFSRALVGNFSFRDSTSGSAKFSGSLVTVNFGSRTETFTLTSGNYISNQKSGSTFETGTGGYLYRMSDGTAVTYGFVATRTMYGPDGSYSITSIKLPTGEVSTYNYKVVQTCFDIECNARVNIGRIQSVTSTNGYMLKMNFSSNSTPESVDESYLWFNLIKVTALNMAVDYCDPAGDGCTYSQTWPSLTINVVSGGTSFTDSLGQTTTYTYTSNLLTGIKRPGAAANTTTISYLSGKVSQIINEGITTNYAFSDASGIRTATISDPVPGNHVVKSNIANAQVTEDTNELGKKISFTYDATTRLMTSIALPEGNSIEYAYDQRGNVIKTTAKAKAGSGLADIVTEATFPASDGTQTWRCASGIGAVRCNKPLTTKDAKGNITQYTNDDTHGGLTKLTLPPPSGSVLCPSAGVVCPETRYSYASYYAQYKNSSGTLVNFATPVTRLTRIGACQTTASCMDTADETKTAVTYGTSNILPTSVASGSGNGTLTATTAIGYDAIGNKQTVDGPLSGTADTNRYYYDALRRVTGIVGPDPDGAGTLKNRALKFTFTNNFLTLTEVGTANNQSDPMLSSFSTLRQSTPTFDANGRKIKEVLTAPTTANKYQIIKYSYDTRGMPECTAIRMNTANWDGSQGACALETAGGNGPDRIMRNLYDEVGRLKQVQNGYGTDLQRNDTTLTYTDNGLASSVADAKSNLTTYEYDGHDRLARTRYPNAGGGGSSTTDYQQPSYDANGNITSLRLRDGQSIAFTYDNLNRLTFKNLPGSEPDVSYGYDILGGMTSASQSGYNLSFTYDALSRNLTQTGPQGTTTYQYDLAGRRIRTTWPDSFYVTYDYLLTGEMTAVRENGAASGIGLLATYTYDNLGVPIGTAFGNGTSATYTPDAISRLSSLTVNLSGTAQDLTLGFSYNPASQILQSTRSNDAYAWNGYLNVNRAYGVNGRNQYTNAGSVSLDYDGRGNLTSSGSSGYGYSAENYLTTGPSTSLSYDPMGRLYQVTGSATTRLAYDGTDLIAEYTSSNALVRRYVHGAGIDTPIVWYEGSGTTDRRWLHADERGSIAAVTDGAGNTVGINSYDEYGIPASGNLGRFQYTGQTWLSEIGMYYYKARIYSPTLGRFMQTDPIGYQGGMNLYAYTGNDPINLSDPSGLDSCVSGYANCPQGSGTDYGRDWTITGSGCTVWDGCVSLTNSMAIENIIDQISRFNMPGQSDSGDDLVVNGTRTKPSSKPGRGIILPNDWLPQRAQRCAAPGVDVAASGNRVKISTSIGSGTLTAAQLQRAANAINSRWSGQFGKYSVSTNVTVNTSGGRVLLSGSSSADRADTSYLGRHTLNNVNNLNPTSASFGAVAAHEFGHLLGLPDRYSGYASDPGYNNNIMGANLSGGVSAQDIANAIANAGC